MRLNEPPAGDVEDDSDISPVPLRSFTISAIGTDDEAWEVAARPRRRAFWAKVASFMVVYAMSECRVH
jgi:hypothetical protein